MCAWLLGRYICTYVHCFCNIHKNYVRTWLLANLFCYIVLDISIRYRYVCNYVCMYVVIYQLINKYVKRYYTRSHVCTSPYWLELHTISGNRNKKSNMCNY